MKLVIPQGVDIQEPLEIAEDVFWVGYVVPNDPFQCHVYLIRNGEESILIDPGSMITFPVVLEKIFKVLPLKNIKYIIFHHQDPDIVGCFSTLEALFPKDKERFIVTHWRSKTLLKHYMWKTPFYLIDKHDWQLQAGDRKLEFIFTPYAHFPGAFCTFDPKTKTLFSSDIFGAISDTFFLFAEDNEEYYEGLKLFHKHYMPSRLILNHALERIMRKDPKLIAPQHGSIIEKSMIDRVFKQLKDLNCGLYLLDEKAEDLLVLNRIEELLKKLFNTIMSSSNFEFLMENLYEYMKEELPSLERIDVYGRIPEKNKTMRISVSENGVVTEFLSSLSQPEGHSTIAEDLETEKATVGKVFFVFNRVSKKESSFVKVVMRYIKYPLAVSLEKEIEIRLLHLEKEKERFFAIRDPLTSLYNRRYLMEKLRTLVEEAEKLGVPLSLAVIDIDYFKRINDTYGHLIGDCVLKDLARILESSFRRSDIVARYGGEEFVVVLPMTSLKDACKKIDSFRKSVEKIRFCNGKIGITVSAGVVQFRKGMTPEELIEKADRNLYEAKKIGRNRVVCHQ